MKPVHVIMENSEESYWTEVNPEVSDEEIRRYFVGQKFTRQDERTFMLCVDVEITPCP